MEMGGGAAPPQGQQQPPPGAAAEAAAAPRPAAERLNAAVVQQLNLESVKTRALGLDKAISRILGDFDAYARANSSPKWQDVIGQFSMVSMELFNIVEDIKKVSKAFAVYPRNVSAENAAILPVMLSSKLLPEMEAEDNTKREQLLPEHNKLGDQLHHLRVYQELLPGQHQMQYSQSLSQHFQNRQMQSMQQNMAQNQLNQGSQLRSHLSQFTGAGNNALLNAAQASPNSQMISNISTAMQSQSFLPRMQQFGLNGGHPQRNHASQMLNDQMFGMGASNPSSMVGMQQQQQSVFGNMQTNVQNLQPGMVTLPNPTQNPNFPQQRQQNQQ
ncbi:Mediator of RNA polymerase II transcription subunit 8 [Ananas comosus]|uniref:Mediator of RNA polymerase II transcription subunit 8 n=1 Tax=Ananas comosus TaxID=4615 RepID=A0A199VIS4_ANACO|nr:Mediator of RNA polymerase II transcription subunit 8 [Ananas comosus]